MLRRFADHATRFMAPAATRYVVCAYAFDVTRRHAMFTPPPMHARLRVRARAFVAAARRRDAAAAALLLIYTRDATPMLTPYAVDTIYCCHAIDIDTASPFRF